MTVEPAVFICCLNTGMDELPVKQRTVVGLLRNMQRAGRFSVYEACATTKIATLVDEIMRRGLVRATGGAFPWTNVEVTAAGEALLGESRP